MAAAVEESPEGNLSEEIPKIVAPYTFVVFRLKPAGEADGFLKLDNSRVGKVHFC